MRPDGSSKYAGVMGIHRNHAYIHLCIYFPDIYYYLSSDPRKVRDEFKIKTSIAGGIFFTFFGVMMLLFIRKSNEETMDYQKQPKIKI